MENIINDINVIVLKSLPFGDYNIFVNKGIPSIFIVNSTDYDIDWYKGNMRMFPDFARTMHQITDAVNTFDDKGMIMIYEFLKEKLL